MANIINGTEHYVNRPEGKVYYVKTGSGKPVILLHSAGYNAESWSNVVPALANHFTCIAVDFPGYDHSDEPRGRFTVEDLAKAVIDVMDHAGVKKASFVGDHTGAIVAVHIAVTRPHLVDRLVCDGLPYWDKESGSLVFERFMKPRYKDTTSYGFPVYAIRTWEEFHKINPEASPAGYEKYVRLLKKCRLYWRYTHEATSGYDVQAIGPKITQPILVIFSEGDFVRRAEPKMKATINGVRIVTLPPTSTSAHYDTKYWPEVQPVNPERFNELTLNFLLGRD